MSKLKQPKARVKTASNKRGYFPVGKHTSALPKGLHTAAFNWEAAKGDKDGFICALALKRRLRAMKGDS